MLEDTEKKLQELPIKKQAKDMQFVNSNFKKTVAKFLFCDSFFIFSLSYLLFDNGMYGIILSAKLGIVIV